MTEDAGVPTPGSPSRAWLGCLVVAAIGWRLWLAHRTPVPAEDGVSYLWMAQRFAAGDWAAALAEVFPPGFPLLCAGGVAIGVDAWTVAVACGVLAAGLCLLPLVAIAEHVRPGAGLPAAVLWTSSSLLARNAAEVYSEPPFLLAMALGCCCGLRAQWWRLGMWSGVAFWIRPEGALLAVAFVFARRRAALMSLVPVVGAVLALAATRWACGHGFDPLPIHEFHAQRDDLAERGHVWTNLLQIPAAWFEAFGPAGLLPLFAMRRRGTGPLVWQVVLQIAVVCMFVVRRRFFLSAAVPALALAGAAVAVLPRGLRHLTLAALAAFGLASAWNGTIEPDRLAERRVGEFLAARLQPGDELTGDLTRVLWFAGRRPLPPRHFAVAELLAMASPPAVRFVVLSERSRREQYAELVKGLADRFERLVLPRELDELARARGVAVFARR